MVGSHMSINLLEIRHPLPQAVEIEIITNVVLVDLDEELVAL